MPRGVGIPGCMERQAEAFDFVLQWRLACASNHKYGFISRTIPCVFSVSLLSRCEMHFFTSHRGAPLHISRACADIATQLQRYMVISHLLALGWSTDSVAECCFACAARYTSCHCNARSAAQVAQPFQVTHRYRQSYLSADLGRLQGNRLNLTWRLTSQEHDSHQATGCA